MAVSSYLLLGSNVIELTAKEINPLDVTLPSASSYLLALATDLILICFPFLLLFSLSSWNYNIYYFYNNSILSDSLLVFSLVLFLIMIDLHIIYL